MSEFKKLGINDEYIKSLKNINILVPTKIQEESIPIVFEGKDLIAGSKTGSGKTLAFGLGILQNLKKENKIQALILTPTRELAEQVSEALISYSTDKINVVPVYGGVSIHMQIKKLQNAQIVVATPGRMLDHIQRNTINLKNVKTVVLDEADRMLDMGFIQDVERILKTCPKQRQTLLFTATLSEEINRLSAKHMNNPEKVSIESNVDPTKLKQTYYDVTNKQKFSFLMHHLSENKDQIKMIFCNTQKNTDFIADNLKDHGIKAKAIHGGLTQKNRNQIIENFHKMKFNVLVCTDVAARGLDIQDVSIIYNYDIPNEPKQYIHRIGRTARAGKDGIAINIVSPRDHQFFSNVLRENNLKIKKADTPEFKKVILNMDNQNKNNNRGRFGNNRNNNSRSRFSDDRSNNNRSRFSDDRSNNNRSRFSDDRSNNNRSRFSDDRSNNNRSRFSDKPKRAPRKRY